MFTRTCGCTVRAGVACPHFVAAVVADQQLLQSPMARKAITGDLSYGPFNVPFTKQERRALHAIDDLRARIESLKVDLRELPIHACAPPENYAPERMEEFVAIARSLLDLEARLRWIPGGAYRFDAEGK